MRLFCTIPLILCAAGAYAQVLNVDSVQELKLQRPVERAVIAPSGEYLLLSDYNYSGLTKVDLQSKKKKSLRVQPEPDTMQKCSTTATSFTAK